MTTKRSCFSCNIKDEYGLRENETPALMHVDIVSDVSQHFFILERQRKIEFWFSTDDPIQNSFNFNKNFCGTQIGTDFLLKSIIIIITVIQSNKQRTTTGFGFVTGKNQKSNIPNFSLTLRHKGPFK